jgi:hypothetical protein
LEGRHFLNCAVYEFFFFNISLIQQHHSMRALIYSFSFQRSYILICPKFWPAYFYLKHPGSCSSTPNSLYIIM